MKATIAWWSGFMTEARTALFQDLGLLLIRLGFGLTMAFSHGLGKVQKFLVGGEIQWADPIGLGAGPSLFLAGAAEFFCALAVVFGLWTRVAAVPLAFTMGVAILVVHGDDPFQKKEFALLYLIPWLTLILAGPGRFSVDAMLRRKFGRKNES